jgi:glycosyltransferase involved in cell wall biosynthesis
MGKSMMPRISVVMGFRDWGLDRLGLALQAHRLGTMPEEEVELIVVDYGSADVEAIVGTTNRWGARVVRVNARGRWNRSHCLNVGIREARASRVLTTDADILFTPRTIQSILESVAEDRDFFLIQCRDLPAMDLDELSTFDFQSLDSKSTLRPPWGMGGCACFRKAFAIEVRGYDERLEWWGSEDNDFVQRAMQHGEEVHWLDKADARCYHVWHPKLTDVKAKDEKFQEVVKRNRILVSCDTAVVRNAFPWGAARPARPTVSACIITRNRAHLIGETIESLLQQTYQNFEIVIVDDGSEDHTKKVVEGYKNPRIKYIKKKQEGIPTARNAAVAEASGDYICIVDDDDIQLPDRIERHLTAVEDGYVGSYGGWIDFDEELRELYYYPGRPYSLESLLFTPKVLIHPASFVLREVLQSLQYNEEVLYGSDFDLALRIAASGYKLKHVGAHLILRRLHSAAVTAQHSSSQKRTAHTMLQKLMAALTPEELDRARKVSAQCVPLTLSDPFDDPSLLLRIPPAFARFVSSAKQQQDRSSRLDSQIGQLRLLQRGQQRPARLEVGPFVSAHQCELHLARLKATTELELMIESRPQGTTEIYYVAWPWTVNGEAWAEQDRVERTYRYPNQVALKELAATSIRPSINGTVKESAALGLIPLSNGRLLTQPRTGIADEIFPLGANVLVISRGDDRLLELGSVSASHFPQTTEGTYAGYHPANSAEAIAHLDALQSKGAEYLVVPASSLWWLEHYEDFRRHLERRCRLVYYEENVGLVYALDRSRPAPENGLKSRLRLTLRPSKPQQTKTRVDVVPR